MTFRVHMLGVVSLNGGDAAILASEEVILRTRWPDLVLTVSDASPDAAARYMPHLAFTPFASTLLPGGGGRAAAARRRAVQARMHLAAGLWGRGLRSAARRLLTRAEWHVLEPFFRADVIAYTGGTSLTDNYDLGAKIFDLRFALRLRKPVVFMAQSAGPFRKSWNRDGLRPVFSRADLVMLRDERSKEYVQDVGALADRAVVVPDVVFALALPPGRRAPRAGGPVRVAVSVRQWAHFTSEDPAAGMARYRQAISDTVVRLVEDQEAEITFISTCQGRPEYWLDDSALAQEIADGLPAHVRPAVRVDRGAWTPQGLIDELTRFDLMVSTRLHGAITALCAGTPVLPIAYEFKTVEVFKQLGLQDWVLDIEDVDGPALLKLTKDLVDRRDEVAAAMTDPVQELKAGALDAGRLVGDVVDGRR